jgi:hypothetical protein
VLPVRKNRKKAQKKCEDEIHLRKKKEIISREILDITGTNAM